MRRIFCPLLLAAALAALACLPSVAQEPPTADDDSSSERVEESDEAFRRRMELEDARHRDPGYIPPAGTQPKKQEKIDALPPDSRDNIRDQLVDIIMANDAWEPADALEDYPYEPTEAARGDRALLEQEQAAWDEQIEKYHQREAEAFGAQRSAAGAPGEAGGEAGAEASSGAAGGPQGSAGSPGGETGRSGAAGTYSPSASNRQNEAEEPGTAGAQQSALDFLRGREGQAAPPPAAMAGAIDAAGEGSSREAATQAEGPVEAGREAESEREFERETVREIPGIIAIEDLDKLEGAGNEDEPGERDDSLPPD